MLDEWFTFDKTKRKTTDSDINCKYNSFVRIFDNEKLYFCVLSFLAIHLFL